MWMTCLEVYLAAVIVFFLHYEIDSITVLYGLSRVQLGRPLVRWPTSRGMLAL